MNWAQMLTITSHRFYHYDVRDNIMVKIEWVMWKSVLWPLLKKIK